MGKIIERLQNDSCIRYNTIDIVSQNRSHRLLEKLFVQVLIPQAVFDEFAGNERFKFEADQIGRKQFIKVKAVKNSGSASIFKRATGFDQGESEEGILVKNIIRCCWIS